MDFTRRKFLRAGAASALLAGFALDPSKILFAQRQRRKVPGFDIPHESKTDPVFYFDVSTFAPYVGSEFRLSSTRRGGGEAVRLGEVLDRLAAGSRGGGGHEGVCFSLFFQGPARKSATRQGIYRIEHSALGTFSLFLVPGPQSAAGVVTYEAVINRLA